MVKNKITRSLDLVGASQHETELKARDKFAAAEQIAQPKVIQQPKLEKAGRISPQLSCTIAQEDKELLDKLALYAANKQGKLLTMSTLIRGLIRLGNKHKDEIEL